MSEEVKEQQEQQEQSTEKTSTVASKFKSLNSKKVLMAILTAFIPIAILIITWIPFILDIYHFNFQKWLTASLINVGICIAAIVLGEIMGDDKQREKVNGLYQNALKRFETTFKQLKETGLYLYFAQFFTWFKARELKQLKEDYLVDNNIDPLQAHFIIEYAELEDVEKMLHGSFKKYDESSKKEIPFKKITQEQYEVIRVIYSANFKIDTYDYTYYLSEFNDGVSKSILLRGKTLNKKLKYNKTFRRTFKIVLYIFISFLFGLATIQDLTSEGAKEAVMNTNTRMLAFVGGLLSGFMTAVISVKIMAQILEDKCDVQETCIAAFEKKEFVPKSYEEVVEEAIEQETKEKEEAIKTVVIPEVVDLDVKLLTEQNENV